MCITSCWLISYFALQSVGLVQNIAGANTWSCWKHTDQTSWNIHGSVQLLETAGAYLVDTSSANNDPFWRYHPVWKDHSPVCENLSLPLDPMQTGPFWNDHLSGKTTFSWHERWSFQTGFAVYAKCSDSKVFPISDVLMTPSATLDL